MANVSDFLAFLDEAPTPFHAVQAAAARLEQNGFVRSDRNEEWAAPHGRKYTVNAGSLVAWIEPTGVTPESGFRILGAHTDSPNLRVKHHHNRSESALSMVALEPYGGVILESWLDRDLGLAGRLVSVDGSETLVRIDEPWLRVPRLAIHLDRDENKLDRQRHLDAVLALGNQSLVEAVATSAGAAPDEVAAFELMTFDLQGAQLTGKHSEFISSGRLDNLATCWAALDAFCSADDNQRSVLVLFDHEEVGSTSDRGASSPLLESVLERLVLAAGGGREAFHRALASSFVVSGDMAHATHPNYREKHEPLHTIETGGGPVVKINQNLRYATDARGSAILSRVAAAQGIALQHYVHRADLPCGSTIGPLSAARTGILTVDVGAPQLAMHSAREFMAASDQVAYRELFAGVLNDRSSFSS